MGTVDPETTNHFASSEEDEAPSTKNGKKDAKPISRIFLLPKA